MPGCERLGCIGHGESHSFGYGKLTPRLDRDIAQQ